MGSKGWPERRTRDARNRAEISAAFGIELTTENEHAAISLVAIQPATPVGAVVSGEHAVGIEAQPGRLREGPHLTGFERIARAHEDALERLDLLDADILGQVGNHGHVA
jgi:hypothetical protein